MSERKRLPENIKEIESKILESVKFDKDASCGNKSQNHSKHQDNQDDLLNSKESICSALGLNSTTVRNILQAARRNNALTTKAIIQNLGLSEFKADILKSVIDRYMNYNEYYRADVIGANQGSGNNSFTSTRYIDNYARVDVQNALVDCQIVFNNANISVGTSCGFNNLLHVLQQNEEQDSSHNVLYEHSPDGDGYGDENSKLTVDSIPLGSSPRYLMMLENKASKEINAEVPTKENDLLYFSKTIFDKLSWCEKCEESNVDFTTSADEEYDNELLALANLLYGEEAANMTDQLIINSLDDIMQQSQATEAEENQQFDDDDDSVVNDSSSAVEDNGGGGILPEDVGALPLQMPLIADEGVVVDEESTLLNGNHELAGTERTIPVIDYVLQQSQVVGKQSHQFTYTLSETTGSHHCLTNNTSSITVTTNELIGNLAVHATQDSLLPIPQDHHSVHGDNESNNEGENNAVEQASEPPLIDFLFEHTVLPPSTLQDHSISQFPLAEDQPILIPDEVDDASAPTEDMPEVYVDAVEVQPEDSEDNCHLSLFVSSSAENVDDKVEEVHMQPPPKFRWWRDCRLF